jgi:hypothetical protein
VLWVEAAKEVVTSPGLAEAGCVGEGRRAENSRAVGSIPAATVVEAEERS